MPAVYIGQRLFIKPTYVVSLPEYAGLNFYHSHSFIENQKNLKNREHNGKLSEKALKGLRNSINWLLAAAEPKPVYHSGSKKWFSFRVNFITLTLPDTRTVIDNKILQDKLLNPFLTYCRKYLGLNNYVWKLEFQKNGKLHVHLASDTFIHWRRLRTQWNMVLRNNGYLIDFYNKFGHSDPNSTDVHSVRNIKNLAAYISKYMSKQDSDLKKVKGRIWGCSQALSQCNSICLSVCRNDCNEQLTPLHSGKIKIKHILSEDKITKLMRSCGEIYFFRMIDWIHNCTGVLKEKFCETILFLQGTSMTEQQLQYVV